MRTGKPGPPDPDADYESYVRPRLPGWRRVAYLMCGGWDRGDDLVQRMLTELYRKWPRAREAHNLDGLVRTMLTRRLLDERRLGWSRVRLTANVPDQVATVSPTPGNLNDRVDLAQALLRVAPRQRAVLVLRFFHDLSVEETARAMRCSVGTVKSQTAKGLLVLRQVMAPSTMQELR